LYFEERGQYAFLDNKYRSGASVVEVVEEQPICNWYGPDHLLRLLGTSQTLVHLSSTNILSQVLLPEILSKSSLDGYSMELIGIYVQNLLRYGYPSPTPWFTLLTTTAAG